MNADEDGEDEEDVINEVRFVPADKSKLDAMYKAMSECQALHPDPADEVDDDDDDEEGGDEDEDDDDADGVDGNGDVGDEPMDVVPGQFDDANQP